MVIKNGEIIEHGIYSELTTLKDHLATLVGDNIDTVTELHDYKMDRQDDTSQTQNQNSTKENISNGLTLSLNKNVSPSNENRTEKNQMSLTGNDLSKHGPNRMSLKSIRSNSIAANPNKLVLDDQSVEYKEAPFWSYLKAGKGVRITIFIFILFFMVHLIRILSGKIDLFLNIHITKSPTKYIKNFLCIKCCTRCLFIH